MSLDTKQHTYKIDNKITLVDLNGASNNFEITVSAYSKANTKFLYSIVDQTMLDDNGEPDFQETLNMKRTFQHVNKPFQNYFLMLKSPTTTPIDVDVTILLSNLAKLNQPGHTPLQDTTLTKRQILNEKMKTQTVATANPGNLNDERLLKILLALLVLFVIIYCVKKRH